MDEVVSFDSLYGHSRATEGLAAIAPQPSPVNQRLNCVDLFAGAGGFSLAAKSLGINLVAAVEFNQHACETYRHNIVDHDGPILYQANILDMEPEALAARHFGDERYCDLVLGGPPCQGFSVHRIKGAGIGDPRNKLILRYFEFVEALRPKAFLMENVPGLLWPRHRRFLDEFYTRGAEAGYRVLPPETLDARDYGIPQRRKRVFILGLRNDIEFAGDWPPAATHGNENERLENPRLLPWQSAWSIFSESAPPGDENDRHMNHSSQLVEVFKSTPPNGGSRHQSKRVLPCHKSHNGHSDVYGRIDPSESGPTMTTACINPSKGRFVHPTEHHGITLRQAARFQTFPDKFVFKGGLMAAGEQIGNAVPVALGRILIAAITEGLVATDGKLETLAKGAA